MEKLTGSDVIKFNITDFVTEGFLISPGAKLLYFVIVQNCGENDAITVSLETLRKKIAVSKPAMRLYIGEIVKTGLVTLKREAQKKFTFQLRLHPRIVAEIERQKAEGKS
ncbi:hypothetical protein [Fundidesulfovibrio putealis]|uniref:hypothetical protein n=1 Tax=Fundidesulfovibrio putealis TaxID=270496 RepID=UPI000483E4D3|nr:hypothetical protein [Fundidesulfovibrio putealis]KAF0234922.1 MAG: hypothetical protein FD177_485 [Desulfovibrionaceae bacterium]